MAHSSLLNSLLGYYRKALLELKKENPDLVKGYLENYNRRKFLKISALATGSLVVAPALINFSCKEKLSEDDFVAILGGGIAGLSAAYELQKMGIPFKVFEADKRTGGRVKTKRDFINGLTTDCGGEFVDTTHADLLTYLKEFSISTIDVRTDQLIKDTFFYNGKIYSDEEVVNAYKKILPKIIEDQNKSEKDDAYNETIDNTPLDKYFASLGGDEWFIKCLEKAYESEYGGNIREQSAINFLSMMLQEVGKTFEVFGVSDEVLKIKGGSSTLTEALAEKVKDQVFLEHKLQKVTESNGTYALHFSNGKVVSSKYVLITIPFTILKDIPLELKNITENKKNCIQELGYGTNVKLIQKFDKKVWREKGYQGYLFNNVIHNGFDSSQLQNASISQGTYTFYFGGDDAMKLCQKEQLQSLREKYIGYFDTIFPGAIAATQNHSKENEGFIFMNWPLNPFSKCSYSSFKPGQWTKYGEEVSRPIDNVYFAGEHCSDDFQGFMNGAIETAKKAVQNIASSISQITK